MKNLKETPEIIPNPFKVGDIITCPSDLTATKSAPEGIKWEVLKIDHKDTVFAKILEGQNVNEFYPKTIEITPHAYSGWKKVG